jgi:hypothetical protein
MKCHQKLNINVSYYGRNVSIMETMRGNFVGSYPIKVPGVVTPLHLPVPCSFVSSKVSLLLLPRIHSGNVKHISLSF